MERRLRQHGYMDAALVSNLAVEPIARASYVIMFALFRRPPSNHFRPQTVNVWADTPYVIYTLILIIRNPTSAPLHGGWRAIRLPQSDANAVCPPDLRRPRGWCWTAVKMASM